MHLPEMTLALEIHRTTPGVLSMVYPCLTYDKHGGVSAQPFFQGRPEDARWQQASAATLRQGGIRLTILSYGVNEPAIFPGEQGTDLIRRVLQSLLDAIAAQPDALVVKNQHDLQQMRKPETQGFLLHLSGSRALNGAPERLREFFDMGVRAIHPFSDDAAVGGYAGGDRAQGITTLGSDIVKQAQQLNMILDVTHANDRTFDDLMRLAKGPVIDSHTNCRALCEHERNRTDEQLRQIAQTGGVAGVHFSSLLIDGTRNPERIRLCQELKSTVARIRRESADAHEFMARRFDPWLSPRSMGGAAEDSQPIPRAPLERLIDHVEHMAEVMGVDHVGIGTDYTNGDNCADVEMASELPNFSAALLRRGWSTADVRKVLGENFLRVFEQVLPRS